ncbi:MAG: hypothetical protein M3O86_03305 [Actinomycetota bacterium]|nr:hypothetical protein [Actinomycetota bacterium]
MAHATNHDLAAGTRADPDAVPSGDRAARSRQALLLGAALVAVTAVWGATFPLVKAAV